MRKRLVAFRAEVLDELERFLLAPYSLPPILDEALLEVRRAKALYAGEGPVRLMPRKESE
jgi:hypothetical protein